MQWHGLLPGCRITGSRVAALAGSDEHSRGLHGQFDFKSELFLTYKQPFSLKRHIV